MQASLAPSIRTVPNLERVFAPGLARSPYLVHPIVDGLFVCGGLPWILGLWLYFYPAAEFSNSRWLVGAMFTHALTFLFNDAHTAATWLRMYANKESRQRFRLHSTWLLIPSFGLVAVSLYVPSVSAAMVKLYVLWVVQHYIAQTYGLMMIYSGRSGFVMTTATKRWLKISISLLTIWGVSLQLSPYQLRSFLIAIPVWEVVPEWGVKILTGLLSGSLVMFAAALAEQTMQAKKFPPWTILLLFVSIVVFITARGSLAQALWIFVPPFFHGSQYLIVSGVFHMRERGIGAKPALVKNGIAYLVSASVLGFLAYEFAPAILDSSGFPASLAAIFSPMNFHHFLSDRAMWKLRDPKTRAVVVGRP